VANNPFYEQLSINSAFLGARTQRLSDLISEQGNAFFRDVGLVVPVRCNSTILFLHNCGPSSLVEIARALDLPHQLVAQRTSLLEEFSILTRKADPNDQRRRTFHLTRKGKREADRIEQRCRDAIEVFENVNKELGVNLGKILDAAHAALSHQTMLDRTIGRDNPAKKNAVRRVHKSAATP